MSVVIPTNGSNLHNLYLCLCKHLKSKWNIKKTPDIIFCYRECAVIKTYRLMGGTSLEWVSNQVYTYLTPLWGCSYWPKFENIIIKN